MYARIICFVYLKIIIMYIIASIHLSKKKINVK